MPGAGDALAVAARKYGVESSASLDPYEEPEIELGDSLAIQEWLVFVEREMTSHRSPFVAAVVLLKHLEEFAERRMKRPERLYAATALPVLHHCLPALTPEHRSIISAAIQELAPAMGFIKLGPAAMCGASAGGAADGARRVAYAECFWRVFDLHEKHRCTMEVDLRREAVESAVMDRVVLSLDRLWVRVCFLSWKIHCRRIREKKLVFRKLAHRGMAGHIVPQFIRAWRQHAHSVMLRAKIARSSAVAQELEALYPQEQHIKGLHERTSEEVKEKMRLLKDETSHCEQVRTKLDTLRSLHEETDLSLREHWATWRSCMAALFGDSHPINRVLEEDYSSTVTYTQNITDNAELYSKRARARTGNVGLKQIQNCLRSQGYLAAEMPGDSDVAAAARAAIDEDLGPVSPAFPLDSTQRSSAPAAPQAAPPVSNALLPVPSSAVNPARRSGDAAKRGRFVRAPAPVASVAATVDALRHACAPAVSPLRMIDLLHGNQDQINVALSFMSCMFSGGHCSLFWQSAVRRDVDMGTGTIARLGELAHLPDDAFASASRITAGGADEEEGEVEEQVSRSGLGPSDDPDTPPANIGVRMIANVAKGMENTGTCSAGNDRYMLSLRRCMEGSPADDVYDYAGNVFSRMSTMGLPMDGDKVIGSLASLVRAVEGPVIRALYPAKGIYTFTAFSEYLTKVAEFTSHPLISIVERLENGYRRSPREEMLYTLGTSDEIHQLLRDSNGYLASLAEWAKHEQLPQQLSKERAMDLLTVKLGLPEHAAVEAWECAGADKETVARDELDHFLLLAALRLDPSPFNPPADKLAAVIDTCVPFLLDL